MADTPAGRGSAAELDERHPDLKPRRVKFDWENTPLHWIPEDPYATHIINVLHLLLPAGERWFVHVYKQVLPYIRDERLKAEVKGFMGQEGTHAVAHQNVLYHMKVQGLDPDPFVGQIEWLFEQLLGDTTMPPFARKKWLRERLAIIAAIEHFTAVLGKWIVDSRGLDAAGADPVMLDLLRWHGAEEVEHRSVAYDVFMHLDGSYARRTRAMIVTSVAFAWIWGRGAKFMVAADPNGLRPGRPPHMTEREFLGRFRAAARRDRLPTLASLVAEVPKYLKPSYHPSRHGSTQSALDYLAISPAAVYAAELAAARKDGVESAG
ncbi:metal-dependent hydrolase [Catenulispora sp. NF23]|uniref:Metal-dependent hydrolase n=1 Tax=Catenulispora pinistramenti TaxID=2705254 RepID=A0ABS5KNT2_9ACTN|nr:metal-dependent hydrolase [Catenulispora pinistramenti]MBS2537639.1 metal-dependent hydrolase [Catenulispora pinistramenti]MBS2547696.1 metal-dependent hydrolase [Catenulispora pinistramenti]